MHYPLATNELTTQLAVSLAPKGIRVNAVLAGGNLSLNSSSTGSPNALLRHVDSALEDPEKHPTSNLSAVSHLGLNKTGSVHNIATAIRFLASDDASFITGQTLFVDGGASLRQKYF